MSSYLNIYLIPRKEHMPEQKPLFLMQWSRSSEVYQRIKEAANPMFIGSGEKTNYSDLTKDDLDEAIENIQNSIKSCRKRIQARVEALNKINNPPKETLDEFIQENIDTSDYITELEETKSDLYALRNIIADIQYSDFEKVVCNID